MYGYDGMSISSFLACSLVIAFFLGPFLLHKIFSFFRPKSPRHLVRRRCVWPLVLTTLSFFTQLFYYYRIWRVLLRWLDSQWAGLIRIFRFCFLDFLKDIFFKCFFFHIVNSVNFITIRSVLLLRFGGISDF